jgi:hypothetical protein
MFCPLFHSSRNSDLTRPGRAVGSKLFAIKIIGRDFQETTIITYKLRPGKITTPLAKENRVKEKFQ